MSTTVEPGTQEHPATGTAPAADGAQPTTCPNCGAPADPGQLMCLECGARLALDYQRAPSWRLPAMIVGVVVLLAGIGVAIALLAAGNDMPVAAANPAAAPQSAPADSAPTTSTPTPAATPTASTPTPAPTTSGTTPAPAPTTPAAAPSGWPPGKSAFTVILASMPSK